MADAVPNHIARTGPVFDHKVKGRARLSNHAARMMLPDLDGRTKMARRFRDVANAIASDQGGADRLSEARLQLIRRFSGLAVLSELREAALAKGEAIDERRHTTAINTMIRLAGKLGLDRMAIDVVPDSTTLQDIIREARSGNTGGRDG
jgi:hypothetical protein